MRASGSHSVTFDGVELPRAALRGGFPAGDAVAYMERNLTAGLFHASASLGIAESAARGRRRALARPRRARRPRARTLLAENAIDLGACRARPRAARVDDTASTSPTSDARRALVRRGAGGEDVRQRGRARGSSTARSRSPAAPATSTATRSRARTATSAPARFMHPLGANRAYDLLGDVALGREPSLH